MDIRSVAARPEDVLVTFIRAMPFEGRSREATASERQSKVAQKDRDKEKQASSAEVMPSGIIKELDPRISTFKNTAISFSINKDSGKMIVKVIDKDTDEVIRQIPPEEMVRLMARMTEIIGVLMDKKA